MKAHKKNSVSPIGNKKKSLKLKEHDDDKENGLTKKKKNSLGKKLLSSSDLIEGLSSKFTCY